MDNLRDSWPKTGMGDGAGRRLGPYRVGPELGRGFSSVVYEALEPERGRCVALKVLTFLPTLDQERRADLAERFAREARAVSALSHPNVVAIYDVGQAEDGRQFIAMECLRGETLRGHLQQKGPLPTPQAVAVAVRVADALHYAHGRGVIHRDVKPDNVFLCEGEEDGPVVPKLMDFGIAHVLSDRGRLTQDGTIVGSPAYMSPEQIHGHALDARTDVFSLAVTLAEMVSGAKPFEAEAVPAVMQRILHHAPDLSGVLDPGLRRVLTRALSKHPHGRYPDAAAFAQALRQAVPLAGLSSTVATQILGDAPRSHKFTLAGRIPSFAAGGLAGLALTILALLPLFVPRATPLPSPTTVTGQAGPRQALRLPVRVRRIAAAWQPTPPASQPDPTNWRIVERATALPPRPRRVLVALTPRPTPTAARPLAPPPPSAPNPPAVPAQPAVPTRFRVRPVLAATLTGAAARPPVVPPPAPIVRVAGSRQELTPDVKSAPVPPETQVAAPSYAGDAPPPAPREPGLADAGPRAVHRTLPILPPGVSVAGGATVKVRVFVDEDGDVSDATVLQSSGIPALDRAALDCVRQWEYDPAIRDGGSAPGQTTEQVKFGPRVNSP